MQLNILVSDHSMNLEVPDRFLDQSGEAFERLDHSMDEGVQMGRDWIETPDTHQRCQVAADKLLTALETDDENLALLSAGYILSRLPGIKRVKIDDSGEIRGTRFDAG
ncbi:MAG: hypothetical protein GY703_10370 [Gammaproteobacteria bacterium]|nr:hypothetical protein [Gammaproteobacteria bacterium]